MKWVMLGERQQAGRDFLWNMLEQLRLGNMQVKFLRMPLLYKWEEHLSASI